MVDIRAKASKPIESTSDDAEMRTRAREAFKASVRQMIGERRPFATLAEMDDIEMMEAATELTRKK